MTSSVPGSHADVCRRRSALDTLHHPVAAAGDPHRVRAGRPRRCRAAARWGTGRSPRVCRRRRPAPRPRCDRSGSPHRVAARVGGDTAASIPAATAAAGMVRDPTRASRPRRRHSRHAPVATRTGGRVRRVLAPHPPAARLVDGGSMLERLGRPHEAAQAYDRAAALARSETEISFLSRRRTELLVGRPGASAG